MRKTSPTTLAPLALLALFFVTAPGARAGCTYTGNTPSVGSPWHTGSTCASHPGGSHVFTKHENWTFNYSDGYNRVLEVEGVGACCCGTLRDCQPGKPG